MNEMKQLSPADVLDQVLVFVGALTERAVVIPERYGSFLVGVIHTPRLPLLDRHRDEPLSFHGPKCSAA
jgi:hypothetical protein